LTGVVVGETLTTRRFVMLGLIDVSVRRMRIGLISRLGGILALTAYPNEDEYDQVQRTVEFRFTASFGVGDSLVLHDLTSNVMEARAWDVRDLPPMVLAQLMEHIQRSITGILAIRFIEEGTSEELTPETLLTEGVVYHFSEHGVPTDEASRATLLQSILFGDPRRSPMRWAGHVVIDGQFFPTTYSPSFRDPT
jgi:hypothetical protein